MIRTVLLTTLCSLTCGCSSGTSPPATTTPTIFNFPAARTVCSEPGDTLPCSPPRCAATSKKCLAIATGYACAYTRSTAGSCACFEGEVSPCYTDAGTYGLQTCTMINDTSSTISPCNELQ